MKLLEQLQNGEGFELGTPWRVTDKHLTVVVPIIRVGSAGKRVYVLVEEVKDKVKISDSGSIDSIKVTGTDKAVLVRSGVVLEGVGTQNRSVESSKIILPDAVITVPVKCVYASHPISPGARMEVSEMYAPDEVHSQLLSSSLGTAGQHTVWSAVSTFQRSSMRSSPSARYAVSPVTDDLLGAMRNVREFRKDIDEVISKMPVDRNDQVGVVIMNVDGVLGMEMFDHPDSWKAASKAVARKYADVLAREGKSSLFELNKDAVQTTVIDFLKRLMDAKERTVSETAKSRTVSFQSGDFVGEYVVFDTHEVHVIVAKNDRSQTARIPEPRMPTWPRPRYPGRREPSCFPPYPEYPDSGWGSDVVFFSQATPSTEAAFDVLKSLQKRPKPWKDLEHEFKKAHRSTKTLSKALKTTREQGLVEPMMRPENGKSVYSLTPQAEKELVKFGAAREKHQP